MPNHPVALIKYEIYRNPPGSLHPWALSINRGNGDLSFYLCRTWLACAEKLREIHPDLWRGQVSMEIRDATEAVKEYVNSITGADLDRRLQR
jgi:hypothetical protein